MTALAVIGSAIVLNAVLFGAAMVWTNRQLKLVAAERAAAYRAMFTLEPLPPQGEEVQILVDDESGMPTEIEAVHWPYLGWVDATTLMKVEDDVLGWRWHPFRERRQEDTSTWSRERLAAKLERMFPSGPAENDS